LAYALGNVILMLFLFYILLNRIAYDWTGGLYLVGSVNCFPSLHAAVSVICFYTWNRHSKVKALAATNIVAFNSFVITVGVIVSTLFLKQHCVSDEIAGIVLACWRTPVQAFLETAQTSRVGTPLT
jgi:membrane-associated phospholipid phosphatase